MAAVVAGGPDLDPFQRLALAFLAEYSPNSGRAYQSDLQAWPARPSPSPASTRSRTAGHHVAARVRQLTANPTPRTGKPLAASSVARRLACLSKF